MGGERKVLKGEVIIEMLRNIFVDKEVRFSVNGVLFTGAIRTFTELEDEIIINVKDKGFVAFVIDLNKEYECHYTELTKMLTLKEVR